MLLQHKHSFFLSRACCSLHGSQNLPLCNMWVNIKHVEAVYIPGFEVLWNPSKTFFIIISVVLPTSHVSSNLWTTHLRDHADFFFSKLLKHQVE